MRLQQRQRRRRWQIISKLAAGLESGSESREPAQAIGAFVVLWSGDGARRTVRRISLTVKPL